MATLSSLHRIHADLLKVKTVCALRARVWVCVWVGGGGGVHVNAM